jgi:hypothetical protein
LAELARGKGFAGALSLAMVGAVLWPVLENWKEEPKDGFPLSYYPMFSLKRPKKADFTYLVGLDADGGRHLLPHRYAGTGGLNQVRRQINRLAREGKAEGLCQRVAERLAGEKDGPFASMVTVQVVTGRYRLAQYFDGKKEPTRERVHASRPVERGAR